MLEKFRSDWKKKIHAEGGHCPLCDRWGQVYSHNFTSSMARDLIWLWKACEDHADKESGDWVNVPQVAPRYVLQTRNLSITEWWGLSMAYAKPKGGHALGIRRITKKGCQFVLNEIIVPDAVFSYNNKVQWWSDKKIRISDLEGGPLGNSGNVFNYRELLALPVEYRKDQ